MLVGLQRAPRAAPQRQKCASPRGQHRIAPRQMQGPPIAAARSGQSFVAESVHLLSFPADTPEDDIAQVVDGIWSLQYMAAGPLCASAGALAQFQAGGGGGGGASQQLQQPAFTHAVLFRYANDASLERFEQQPRVQLMLGGTGAPPGTGITTLNFRGCVPNELEAIFRRGPEWGEGLELVLAAALQGGAAQEDAEEFLSLTQQLAVSSAYGAVQCSYGACLSMQQHSGSGGGSGGSSGVQQQPDVVLLARFEEAPQLQRFLDCPPVAALLEGDDRLPLRALWSGALQATPSDSSTSSGVK